MSLSGSEFVADGEIIEHKHEGVMMIKRKRNENGIKIRRVTMSDEMNGEMDRWLAVGVGIFYKECQLLWKPKDNPFHCGLSLCNPPPSSTPLLLRCSSATYKVRVTLYLSNNGHRLCLAQQ